MPGPAFIGPASPSLCEDMDRRAEREKNAKKALFDNRPDGMADMFNGPAAQLQYERAQRYL